MLIKKIIKQYLFRKKKIQIDLSSNLNYGVIVSADYKEDGRIIDSKINLSKIGEGCFLEYVVGYGDISLGRFVSISGPGTILHAEIGKISIGSFTSIAENVSIQEFNHKSDRVVTSSINHMIYRDNLKSDYISKGNVIIEEDVWIGSNAVILSGVRIGRGGVVAAGSIVTKNVPRYSIVAGNPAKVIKFRFDEETIRKLESSEWWHWSRYKIIENREFLENAINKGNNN